MSPVAKCSPRTPLTGLFDWFPVGPASSVLVVLGGGAPSGIHVLVAPVTSIALVLGEEGSSFTLNLSLLVFVLLVVGFMAVAFAFAIVCGVVASALSVCLWLMIATWDLAKCDLVPRLRRAVGRAAVRVPHVGPR